MSQRTDIWTYLIITAVTVLIWYRAASETRDKRDIIQTVEFVAADDDWLVEASENEITINAEGSQRAIIQAEQIEGPLRIDVATTERFQSVPMADLLANHPLIRESGISVLSTEPATITLNLDEMVHAPIPVDVDLSRFESGTTVIEPPQVDVRLPRGLRNRTIDGLVLLVDIDRLDLSSLVAGVPRTFEGVPLKLPSEWEENEAVTIAPTTVNLTVTIESQVHEVVPPMPVQVQIASPEVAEFLIELEPKQFSDVTVTASDELAREIRSGETVVVAVLHLRFSEIESGIERKPIGYFIAIRPDGTYAPVTAAVGEARESRPVIELTISDRDGS